MCVYVCLFPITDCPPNSDLCLSTNAGDGSGGAFDMMASNIASPGDKKGDGLGGSDDLHGWSPFLPKPQQGGLHSPACSAPFSPVGGPQTVSAASNQTQTLAASHQTNNRMRITRAAMDDSGRLLGPRQLAQQQHGYSNDSGQHLGPRQLALPNVPQVRNQTAVAVAAAPQGGLQGHQLNVPQVMDQTVHVMNAAAPPAPQGGVMNAAAPPAPQGGFGATRAPCLQPLLAPCQDCGGRFTHQEYNDHLPQCRAKAREVAGKALADEMVNAGTNEIHRVSDSAGLAASAAGGSARPSDEKEHVSGCACTIHFCFIFMTSSHLYLSTSGE